MYAVKVVMSGNRCNIDTLLLQSTNGKWNMAYQVEPFPMTLSDFRGHVSIASVLKCDISYSCAAVDNISTDTARRAVSLRQLSFLYRMQEYIRISSTDCSLWSLAACISRVHRARTGFALCDMVSWLDMSLPTRRWTALPDACPQVSWCWRCRWRTSLLHGDSSEVSFLTVANVRILNALTVRLNTLLYTSKRGLLISYKKQVYTKTMFHLRSLLV